MPTTAIFLFTLVFAILLLIYLFYEWKESFHAATFFKVLVSATVFFTALYFLLTGQKSAVRILLVVGLLCAVPADYFLQYIITDIKKYDMGIFCFSGMHICLLVGYYMSYGFQWLDIILWLVILGIILALQTIQKWDLGPQKLQLSIYTGLVSLMAAKAISIGILHPSAASTILLLGGVFFIVSDIILAIWNCHYQKKPLVIANRIFYFVGQLFFALSLAVPGML